MQAKHPQSKAKQQLAKTPKPKNEKSYCDMILESFRDMKLRRTGGSRMRIQNLVFDENKIDKNGHTKNAFVKGLNKALSNEMLISTNKSGEATEGLKPSNIFKLTPKARKSLFDPPKKDQKATASKKSVPAKKRAAQKVSKIAKKPAKTVTKSKASKTASPSKIAKKIKSRVNKSKKAKGKGAGKN